MTIDADKRALRRQMRGLRRGRSEGQRMQASARIVQALRESACVQQASVIGLYWALPEEVVLWPGLQATLLALPVMQGRGRPLAFRAFEGPQELVTASFGVHEPPDTAPEVDLRQIDVLVMPGLAIDARGNRLGYGGGYYDRTLAGLRNDTVTVMVALDAQVVSDVPAGPHDRPVQAVVTPSGWRWLGQPGPG